MGASYNAYSVGWFESFKEVTLHVKHLEHSSAEVVPEKSSHALAKSNSYMGLPMLALSVSWLSSTSPVSGLRVRPLLLTEPVLGALKNRFPEREFIVASMIAANRPMMMFIEKNVATSAAASGPWKHVCSTHLVGSGFNKHACIIMRWLGLLLTRVGLPTHSA